jgi:hypothetical protein
VRERQLDLESHLRFLKDTLPDLVLVDREKAEHGRLSSSRNFEKRPSHASDPVILISSIDSLLYHAKSLSTTQSIMRPIPWMVKRSCGESKPISPCAACRRLWESAACNKDGEPVAPNEDLERAFREIHVLTG